MAVRTTSRFDRIIQTCRIATFLGLISLPFLGLALRLDPPDRSEKRVLASAPAISLAWHSPSHFVPELRSYLVDHFGFRTTLVRWNARINAKALSVSVSPSVLLGRDGWLYYADGHIIDDYRCLQPFTETELRQWADLLERRQRWLRQRGSRYLFVVAPNEHTIYPEFLPAAITRVRDTSRLDQLLAYLKAHSDVAAVDLRPALLAAKARERVYQKTDTHWNERGAFVAYDQMLRPVSAWFPGLRAVPRERFADTAAIGPGGDLASMMGTPDLYREELLGLRPIDARRARMTTWPEARMKVFRDRPVLVEESEAGTGLPRLVLLHDSFGEALKPFLGEHFSRALYVSSAMGFDEAVLEQEHPDLVIQEITERYLWNDYPASYRNRP